MDVTNNHNTPSTQTGGYAFLTACSAKLLQARSPEAALQVLAQELPAHGGSSPQWLYLQQAGTQQVHQPKSWQATPPAPSALEAMVRQLLGQAPHYQCPHLPKQLPQSLQQRLGNPVQPLPTHLLLLPLPLPHAQATLIIASNTPMPSWLLPATTTLAHLLTAQWPLLVANPGNPTPAQLQQEHQHLQATLQHRERSLEQAHQDIRRLSEIGQHITQDLDINKISATVYQQVDKLMDATVFAIGIFNPATQAIEFPLTIEEGKKNTNLQYSLEETNRAAVWCYTHSQNILSNNWKQDFSNYFNELQHAKSGKIPESLIYIPLKAKGHTIGLITVQSHQQNAYTEYHYNMLQNLAGYTAIALENATLYENLEEKVSERTQEANHQRSMLETQHQQLEKSFENTKLLSTIGRQIISNLSISAISRTVYNHIQGLMDVNGFGVGVYYPEREGILFHHYIEEGDVLDDTFYPLTDDNRISVWCFKQQKEVLSNDWRTDYGEYLPSFELPLRGKMAESLIYIPLIHKERTLGVLTVQSFQTNAYTPYHLNLMQNVAVYTSIALENANAYNQLNNTITQLKEAQSQLVDAEKMASLGQLTAGIAHEINNPVNYISAGITSLTSNLEELLSLIDMYNDINNQNANDMLQRIAEYKEEIEYDVLRDEIEDLTASITRGAQRTMEIVKGLRTFSRLDEESMQTVDIKECIESTLVMLRHRAKNRIDIITEYRQLPPVECHAGKINQVFMNLISNAIDAIQDKGRITISTLRPNDDEVTISIADNGPGMLPGVRARIFEPFFTTKKVGEGTGLGLSISLGIIEKHHGNIEVHSEPQQGTTFLITLPVKQEYAKA